MDLAKTCIMLQQQPASAVMLKFRSQIEHCINKSVIKDWGLSTSQIPYENTKCLTNVTTFSGGDRPQLVESQLGQDSEDSTPSLTLLHSNLGQVIHTCVLGTSIIKHYNLVLAQRW